MKKLLSFLLAVLLILTFSGCVQAEKQLENPIRFYYPVSQEHRDKTGCLIQPELREATGYEKNLLSFADHYISGPESPVFLSIFPEDCYPVSICRNGSLVTVYMSSSFAKLTGIDLTLACASLSITLMDFADIETVNICVKDTRLDGQKTITMTRDSFSLTDESFLNKTSP